MTQQVFEAGDWAGLISAHPLESRDPQEWLRYGIALLQSVQPGPDAVRQQQQAALAFLQAAKEGASMQDVKEAQRQALAINLHEARRIIDLSTKA